MKSIHEVLTDKKATREEALGIFDSLEAVPLDFMMGRWKGFEIETGHAIEGMLGPSGWYGKLFRTYDEVYPLLFFSRDKTELFSVNPRMVLPFINFPRFQGMGTLGRLLRPVIGTNQPKARIRMVEHRGKSTASMIYDEAPIIDHFVKIDENKVLGLMDFKRDPNPYFFVLERDDHTKYKSAF